MTSGFRFPRSTPEAEGIPSQAILDFVRAVEQHEHPLDALQGFILIRHGKVVAEGWWEPYGPDIPHTFFSLSKSFTSTAIGLAVADGLLTVEDPVLSFFPEESPSDPDENLKSMRVKHLLSMNTGHLEDTTGHVFRGSDDNWSRAFLSLPVERQPGTWFVYNTAATYMLSAIITKLTGKTLLEYLRPRLLDPLGIVDATWEADPRGISQGGTGLHATTEDIARFGQLYLQNGMWQGTRIVSENWIAEATAAHSDNSNTQTNSDWTAGYGYQFWRNRTGGYRGDGAFGQYCIVLPEQDAVLAVNSGVRDMQAVLDKVWNHLLPAMQPQPLPANPKARAELLDNLASLTLPLAEGQATPSGISNRSGVSYKLESNDLQLDSIKVDLADDRATIHAIDSRGEHPLEVGHGAWLKGTNDLHGGVSLPVAASGAWTSGNTYEARVCYYESEFCPVVRFQFGDDDIRLEFDPNVAWGTPAVTTIIGRRID